MPVAKFRDRLAAIDGAVFVRELPPERVVVVLPAGKVALRRLKGIDGVDTVVAERVEHLHSDR